MKSPESNIPKLWPKNTQQQNMFFLSLQHLPQLLSAQIFAYSQPLDSNPTPPPPPLSTCGPFYGPVPATGAMDSAKAGNAKVVWKGVVVVFGESPDEKTHLKSQESSHFFWKMSITKQKWDISVVHVRYIVVNFSWYHFLPRQLEGLQSYTDCRSHQRRYQVQRITVLAEQQRRGGLVVSCRVMSGFLEWAISPSF